MTLALVLTMLAAPTEADQLFTQGRELMDTRPADALPLFEKSFALDPALGTLLNLALCYERTGKTASAAAMFRQAAEWAVKTKQRDREKLAREHLDGLKVATVTPMLTLSAPGLVLELDRVKVDPERPVPVDPGSHTLTASAPGFETWSTTFEAPQTATIVVPALLPEDRSPPRPPSVRASPQRTGWLGTAGVALGAVLLAAGGASFGYSFHVHSQAQQPSWRSRAEARGQFDTAATVYPVSIILLIAGALVGAAGGGWLFLGGNS